MEGSLLEGEHGETLGMVAGPLGEQDQLKKGGKLWEICRYGTGTQYCGFNMIFFQIFLSLLLI